MRKLLAIAAAIAPFAHGHVASANPSCNGPSDGGAADAAAHNHGGNYYYTYPAEYYRPDGTLAHRTSVVYAPACEDTSDVVGFRNCRKFGSWGTNTRTPQITLEAGVIGRRFGSLLGGQIGTVLHGSEQFTYRVSGQPSSGAAVDTALLSSLRASVGLPRGFYTAVEVDVGGLAQPGAVSAEMMTNGVFGSPDLQQKRGFVVDGLGAVGVRGSTHAGGLGVELAGGVRSVSYSYESIYHNCESATSVRAYAPVAEARARGELWLGPWLTAGVTIGTSVLESHTWMGGLYLGVHTRAYNGSR